MLKTRSLIYFYIGIVLLLLITGLFYTKVRWVNADEGAHLSDTQLMSERYIPFVDFQSREPVYVYLLFAGTKILGRSIFQVRMLPFIFFILNGLLIFYLAKIAFDKRIGFFASLIYWFLPFLFVFSPLTKTENFGIFFTLLAFCAFFKYFYSGKAIFALLSGIFSVVAYYSRLADIATFLALFLVFFLFSFVNRKMIKGFLLFIAGYMGGVAIVMGGFSALTSFGKVFFSSLNPFFMFVKPLAKLFPRFSSQYLELQNAPVVKQNIARTWIELNRVVDINLFLLIGFGIVVLLLVYELLKQHKMNSSALVFTIWAGVFMLSYGYYLIQRGLYPQYFTEIIPPLIIVCVFLIQMTYRKLRDLIPAGFFDAFPALFFLLYLFFRLHELPYPNRFLYFLIVSIISVTIIFIFNRIDLNSKTITGIVLLLGSALFFVIMQETSSFVFLPKKVLLVADLILLIFGIYYSIRFSELQKFVFFLIFIFMVTGVVISGAVSGNYISLVKYDSTWSPATVKEVSDILSSDQDNFSVLSGAMIWSFQSHKNPFMKITHPLGYNGGFSKKEKTEIESFFMKHPPKYIIKDGYLRLNFLKYSILIRTAISRNYSEIASINGVSILKKIPVVNK